MGNKSIILIENDVNLRQSIALLFQRAGYNVTAIDCVYYALEILKSGTYHLLISDINITETNNVLIPKMVEAYPNLPLIILTDQSDNEVESIHRQMFTRYLIKPIAPEQLLDAVHTILGNNHSIQHSNHILSKNHS